MLDLDTIMEKIAQSGKEFMTTKELCAFGLNKYYIKKALAEGKLAKITRGNYGITVISKDRRKAETFHEFASCVFHNDFEGAYRVLEKNLENQTTHDYDNHERTYFLLLEKILGKTGNSALYNDQLLEFSEPQTHSYYSYFINFRNEVAAKNFDQAWINMQKFKKLEFERKGKNNISTKLFSHLVFAACHKGPIHTMSSAHKKIDSELVSKKRHYEQLGQSFLHSAMHEYQHSNYEQTIQALQNAMNYASADHRDSIRNVIRMIETYLDLQNSHTVLSEKFINYEQSGDDYFTRLKTALKNNDFLMAHQYIDKCIYNSPNDFFLNFYKELLQKIIDQHSLNKEKKSLEALKEKQSMDSKREQESLKASEEEQSMNLKNEEVPFDFIYNLIYDKKYDQVKLLLDKAMQQDKENRVYFFIQKMIMDLEEIIKYSKTFPTKQYYYRNDMYAPFKRFYEAVGKRDYAEAYECVLACDEIVQKRNLDDLEFVTYRYIIEDILQEMKNNEHLNLLLKSIDALQEKINSYLFDPELSFDKIEKLQILLLQKKEEFQHFEEFIKELGRDIDSFQITHSIQYDQYALQLIEILNLSREKSLNATYFENFSYNDSDLVADFLQAMQVGDYKAALDFILKENWQKKTSKHSQKKYFILYKKLLAKINREWHKQPEREMSELISPPPTEAMIFLQRLGQLKSFVKKRDYVSAYHYYQDYLMESVTADTKEILDRGLLFTSVTQTTEALDLKKQYQLAYRHGDLKKAKQLLDQYKENIERTGLNRTVDYHYARIESMRQEIETPSFVKKEQLYDWANYYFEQKDYTNSLAVINQYIALDQDFSAKGYFLRGRIYEQLHELEKARVDYEKALSIIPEPAVFHQLGNICVEQQNYPEGLKNYLEYEARRPNCDIDNISSICDVYQQLDNVEHLQKYKLLAKKLSKK